MKPVLKGWVLQYAHALDQERLPQALAILDAAWEATQGLTGEWAGAWWVSAQQGFTEGSRKLMEWGIDQPKIKGSTLRERVMVGVSEQQQNSTRLAFEKSTGEAFRGLFKRDPEAFLKCFYGPSSPPLSLKEVKGLVKQNRWDLLPSLMASPGFAPWGGSQACGLVRDLLLDLAFDAERQFPRQASRMLAWEALVSNLPEGMGSLGSRTSFLQAFARRAHQYVVSHPSLSNGPGYPLTAFEHLLVLSKDLGLSERTIVEAFRKGGQEPLGLVGLRLNSPMALEWELLEGLSWTAQAQTVGRFPFGGGDSFKTGASLFDVIVARLKTTGNPRADLWWEICDQQLLEVPAFKEGLRKHREHESSWAAGDWERWKALVKKSHLATSWRREPLVDATPEQPPARRPRL